MTHSPQSVVVRRADLEEVRDLLMERIHGSNARSPAHNARLAVEAMISAAPAPSSLAGADVEKALDEALIYIEQLGENIERNDVDMHLDTIERPFSFAQNMRGRFSSLCAALSPEAPARDVEAYDKFKAPVGSTVWIRATVTDNCTSCCSVVIDAIHGKMHLTVVPRDVAITPRHEAPACEMCNGRGEVGGPTGQTPESFEYVTECCPDCGGTGKHEAPAEGAGEREEIARIVEPSAFVEETTDHSRVYRNLSLQEGRAEAFTKADAIITLRARSSAPEAREGEAVGYVAADAEAALKAGMNRAIYPSRTVHATFPLYTHPAAPSADKLRIAVEALEEITDTDPDEGTSWFHERADQALAAMKAEGAK